MALERSILRMEGITKSFGGTRALSNVTFECCEGEVHALVGENGAGKSTLVKILGGVVRADAGRILLSGEAVNIQSPWHAQRLGIALIHQELNLLPYLDVAQNVFLGREPVGPGGFIRSAQLYEDTRKLSDLLGAEIEPHRTVCDLSIAQRQLVEIMKAVSCNARILVMDEPTASLASRETRRLFELIKSLRMQGVAVIYISHRLDEVFQISDRVTVLKDGVTMGTAATSTISKPELVRLMVGRTLDDTYPQRRTHPGKELLRVEGLSRKGKFSDVSFTVYAGEIVGIAGLVGSGRTEVAKAIFGVDRPDSGEVFVEGRRVDISSPLKAIQHGIGLVPEDRKGEGLALFLSVKENVSIISVKEFRGPMGLINDRAETGKVTRLVRNLKIKPESIQRLVRHLSGGNQQKVALAKWLAVEPRIIIFDEPTRGIDVGAKWEIYQLMRGLANEGKGIIMISSELPEILGMSDRILVMHDGRMVGEVPGSEATEETVMLLATGTSMTPVDLPPLRTGAEKLGGSE